MIFQTGRKNIPPKRPVVKPKGLISPAKPITWEKIKNMRPKTTNTKK